MCRNVFSDFSVPALFFLFFINNLNLKYILCA